MDALHKVLLHDEHMLLGAELALGSDGRHAPHSYAGVDERAAFHEGVALIDLSGLGSRLITGPTAPALASTVFAGRELAIGEVAPEVALTGDGSIASLALVARTGTEELACWDLAGRGDILSSWLAFVAGIEQRGARPFDGCEVEDASEALPADPKIMMKVTDPAALRGLLPDADGAGTLYDALRRCRCYFREEV